MPGPSRSLIRGIDHLLIHTQDLERVFARFRSEFGLPVVWTHFVRIELPLRFHAGRSNRLIGLEFSCANIKATPRKLIERRWVVATDHDRLTITPDRVDGLTLRFGQAPATPS